MSAYLFLSTVTVVAVTPRPKKSDTFYWAFNFIWLWWKLVCLFVSEFKLFFSVKIVKTVLWKKKKKHSTWTLMDTHGKGRFWARHKHARCQRKSKNSTDGLVLQHVAARIAMFYNDTSLSCSKAAWQFKGQAFHTDDCFLTWMCETGSCRRPML